MLTNLELFGGIGGLGIGIHRAGFEQVALIEKSRHCYEVLNYNKRKKHSDIKNWNLVNLDVEDYDFSIHENKITLLSGGPPCQPFSLAGLHNADLDSRNYFPFIGNVISQIRPKVFLFENVKGLTRQTFSNYFEYLKLSMTFPELKIKNHETWPRHHARLEKAFLNKRDHGLKYNVIHRVINAADYGCSQRRERVFIVGFIDTEEINWSFPSITHSEDSLIWSFCDNSYWERHKIPIKQRIINENFFRKFKRIGEKPSEKPWNTIRDAFVDLPKPHKSINHKMVPNHEFRDGAREYKGHTGSVYDFPAKTLKAGSHGVPGGENMIRFPDKTIRYFTIRESARLQGFPDDFIFCSSWGQSVNQLGNSVPISIAEILAKSIKKAFKK